jgi:hypothetical protein
LATQAATLIATLITFRITGLSLVWSTTIPQATLLVLLLLSWLYYYAYPGRSATDWWIAEVILVLFLFLLLAMIAAPSQYAAVALKRPPADEWLAHADALLGVYVPALAAWTQTHPLIRRVLVLCYLSLLPQLFLCVLGLALFKDRAALWEYMFHLHVCSVITIVALALWPAVCPLVYYGFTPLISQARVAQHIAALRAGTLTMIRFDDIDGLVSVPSFHAAAAWMVTWAFRRHRWVVWPLVILNVGLTLSTFLTGVHYLVDVILAVPMCAGSLRLYRAYERAFPS